MKFRMSRETPKDDPRDKAWLAMQHHVRNSAARGSPLPPSTRHCTM
jgi:hypothetical protein